MEFSSFYGGKQGASFVIKKRYRSIDAMKEDFRDTATTNEVNYGEYVVIDPEDISDNDTGRVYRRGLNSNSPDGGAEYIGQFRGPKGADGAAATIDVDSTVTGEPGTNAEVENIGTQSEAHLKFTIPRGVKGDAATVSVDPHPVTGNPGTTVQVENIGTTSNAIFKFTIPKGDKGDTGNGLYLGFEVDDLDELYNGEIEPGNGIPPETLCGKAGYCAIVANYEIYDYGYSITITNAVFGYDYTGRKQDYLPNTGITGILPIENGGTGNEFGYIRTGLNSSQSPTANDPSRFTAEGIDNNVQQSYAHAEGQNTQAGIYDDSYVEEGYSVLDSGRAAHAEGMNTGAYGEASHAEGFYSNAGTAEYTGYYTTGNYSHAEGQSTKAYGTAAHAEGHNTFAGNSTYRESPIILGNYSHAEGESTKTYGEAAHAEGYYTEAGLLKDEDLEVPLSDGDYSHAEGYYTKALRKSCHAEGEHTVAGDSDLTKDSYGAHAEGGYTEATGYYSHAEGDSTVAAGVASHSAGRGTIAGHDFQTVIGKYNDNKETTAFEIGWGSDQNKKNVFEVYQDGYVSMDDGESTIKITKNNNDQGFYDGADKQTFIKFGSDIELPLSKANGGTGNTTGEIPVGQISGILPIAKGGTGNSTGEIPANKITGVLPIANGGTGNNTGEIPVAQISGVLPKAKGGTGNSTGEIPVEQITGILPITKGGTGNSTGEISTDKITGILPIENGGTGNAQGYIQTGAASDHTPNNTATVEGTNNQGLKANCHAEGFSTVAGGTKTEEQTDIQNKTITGSSGTSATSDIPIHLSTTPTSEKEYILFDFDINTPEDVRDYILTTSNISLDYPRLDFDISQSGYNVIASEYINPLSTTKACLFNYNNETSTYDIMYPTQKRITVSFTESGTSSTVQLILLLSYKVRRILKSDNCYNLIFYLTYKTDDMANQNRLRNSGQNGIIDGKLYHSNAYSAQAVSCDYTKKTTIIVDNKNAHAEGSYTTASGESSHANGYYTTAGYDYQTAVGKYNDNKATTLFEVGNGTSTNAKSNALEIYSNGNAVIGGTLTTSGDTTIGGSITTAVPSGITACPMRFGISDGKYGYIKREAGADTFVPFKTSDFNGDLLQENGVDDPAFTSLTTGTQDLATIDNLIQIVPDGTPSQYTTYQVYCRYNHFKIVCNDGKELIVSVTQGESHDNSTQGKVDFLSHNSIYSGEGFMYCSYNSGSGVPTAPAVIRRIKLQYKDLQDDFTSKGGYFKIESWLSSGGTSQSEREAFIPQYIYGLDEYTEFDSIQSQSSS